MKIIKLTTLITLIWLITSNQIIDAQKINTLSINFPESISGDYTIVRAMFGNQNEDQINSQGTFVIDGSSKPSEGCSNAVNNINGFVVFIDRGSCQFSTKVLLAQQSGATAAIICNNAENANQDPFPMGPGTDAPQVNIPSFMMSYNDCQKIRLAVISGGVQVFLKNTCNNPVKFASNVVWGNEKGQGDFNGGVNGWTTDNDYTWKYVEDGNIVGGGYGSMQMTSYSACDGIMAFNSDFLDNGGIAGNFGNGACPAPCSGTLTSPLIDLSDENIEGIVIEFHQGLRQFQSQFFLITSKDGGISWPDTIEFNTEYPIRSDFITGQRKSIALKGYEGVKKFRMKFYYIGNYYFWGLDDITVINEKNLVELDDFYPSEIIGGIGEILSINGKGFGEDRGTSFVSFKKDENNYYSSDEARGFKYLLWSDTLIKMEMPIALNGEINFISDKRNLFSNFELRVVANVAYRQINPRIYEYLIDKNGKGGVTWYVHPAYWENPEIKQAIIDVFTEFRCKTGVNFKLEPLIGNHPLNINYGKHLIFPDSTLNPGTVGYTAWLWSSCNNGAQSLLYRNTQALLFSTKFSWYYGKGQVPPGMAKFRYVLMHELGHAVGLGHVDELGQTMYPIVVGTSDPWSKRDTLTKEEVYAASWFIDICKTNTFNGCDIKPMLGFVDCFDVLGESINETEITGSEGQFQLSPNPATSYFSIINDLDNKFEEELYNINIIHPNGKIIGSWEAKLNEQIDISGIESGIFFVSIQNGDNSIKTIKKLIII